MIYRINQESIMYTVTHTQNGKELKDLSILYVEDDEEIRDQLTQFLSRRVGTLYTASNGLEGLAAFRAHQPDIVVSDIRMPEMDGLDMADAIKHEHPATPVIMTTAFNETDYFLKAIDIGVDKYVMKPVKIDSLLEAIHFSAHALMAERSLRLAATVFDTASEAIVIVDLTRHIVAANHSCADILGYRAESMVGFEIEMLGASGMMAAPSVTWAEVCSQDRWHGEVWLKRRGGEFFPAWLSAGTAKSKNGEVTHHVLVFLDISEQKRREAEILDLNDELRLARDELELRVEERTRDLAMARDNAEEANRAKTQFLSQMSHELRTPMNAILGFTELLQSDANHPLHEDQKECTAEILRAGRHLLDLINDILDLARVETGKLSLSNQPIPLAEILETCLDLIHPLAVRRNIQVNSRCDKAGSILVTADPVRLKQVLINLLSNAVKYNRDAGRIDIDCHAVGSRLHLGVRDTGLGINAEDIQRLFQPFERFGAAMKTQEGTGIGLALAQRLIDLMGGRITVDSQPGEGSTFWLELDHVSGPDTGRQDTGEGGRPSGSEA
jgi:PAS domain S-box-containing protein